MLQDAMNARVRVQAELEDEREDFASRTIERSADELAVLALFHSVADSDSAVRRDESSQSHRNCKGVE